MRLAKTFALVLLVALFLSPTDADAGPGDTLVVQTFTYGWPLLPGWLAPHEGYFHFPTEGKTYEKVLMYYKLKCDPDQNPACGEWDYLTYSRLFEHTGRLDSNQMSHANFIVNQETPDSLEYMNSASWDFAARTERSIVYDDTLSFAEAVVGSGSETLSHPFSAGAPDSRSVYMWKADELTAAGLTQGNISALRLSVSDAASGLHRLKIRLAETMETKLSSAAVNDALYTTVFDAGLEISQTGEMTIHFTQAFPWTGKNLLVDVSFDDNDGDASKLLGEDTGEIVGLTAGSEDYLLDFKPRNHINCGKFPALNDAQHVTFEGWVHPRSFTNWNDIVMRSESTNQRIGMQFGKADNPTADIYLIVGNGANSHGHTTTRPFAPDTWYHIAMVYDGTANSNANRLQLYVNGVRTLLEYNGDIPAFTSDNNADFIISKTVANSLDGMLDDIRVWGASLTQAQIRERMYTDIEQNDPLRSSLLAYWPFNEGSGGVTADVAGSHDGVLNFPIWNSYGGGRVKNFSTSTQRPNIVFEQGSFDSRIEYNAVIDTTEKRQMMVVMYSDTTYANVPTDTLYTWPVYYTFNFDEDGNKLDSTLVPADEVLNREDHFYYGKPYEVINRYELGRYITPYGIGLSLGDGWTWVYDVTDFVHLLKDTVHLQAGNFQELLDMKFVFIEGTPPRDVVKLENVWNGSFMLNTFEATVAPRTIDLESEANMFKLRTTATGHKFSNPTNCAEFCPKIHSVDVNGQTRYNWQIIQECSTNPLYPQGGTWIYARAGWCPGMEGNTREHEVTPWVTGSQVTIDYNSQYDDYGNYVFESQFVQYSAPNHAVDAAIERIIAPSNHELNNRFNPICGQPKIVIKNAGANPLTSVDISYGPRGGNIAHYTWTGSLEFLETEEVTLPSFDWGTWNGDNIFDVTLSNPGGGADENAYNDSQFSYFETTVVYDSPLIVVFKTNNAAYENRYEVLDADGNVIHSRSGFSANTIYRDTLYLQPGCYEYVLHDSGEDGISWWANNDGDGYVKFRLVSGGLWAGLEPDFGKIARHAWRYSNLVGVEETDVADRNFEIYPNPTSSEVTLRFDLDRQSTVRYEIYNMLGQLVMKGSDRELGIGTHVDHIGVSDLQPGSYFVNLVSGSTVEKRMKIHVVR